MEPISGAFKEVRIDDLVDGFIVNQIIFLNMKLAPIGKYFVCSNDTTTKVARKPNEFNLSV